MRGAPVALSGLALPEGLGPLRDHVRPEGRRSEHYLDRYDRLTLAYDAFREGDAVTLVCPRLLNLWPLLREGLRCGGRPVRVRRQVLPRIEILRFRGEGEVAVEIAGWRAALPAGGSEAARFEGRACAVAVSRDNDPDWIEDWARWHRSAHGLEAAVVFDNGSTAYGPEAVEAALARAGLADWAVIPAPFPYGPADGSTRWEVSPRFFQTGMLNVARLRLFPRARAVLSCDIDELVVSRSGRSVFDLAARSPLGVASFFGRWAYPEAPGGPRPQREHVVAVPAERRLNTKWCAAPRGLGRRPWAVHRFGGPAFLLTWVPDLGFRHCRATTTSWKKAPLAALPAGAERDEAFAARLAAHLGGGRGGAGGAPRAPRAPGVAEPAGPAPVDPRVGPRPAATFRTGARPKDLR